MSIRVEGAAERFSRQSRLLPELQEWLFRGTPVERAACFENGSEEKRFAYKTAFKTDKVQVAEVATRSLNQRLPARPSTPTLEKNCYKLAAFRLRSSVKMAGKKVFSITR